VQYKTKKMPKACCDKRFLQQERPAAGAYCDNSALRASARKR
jgi:hypothetical protein